eukprot:scaffold331264_cov19-Prasinocladus_malaysianus.AAC.1
MAISRLKTAWRLIDALQMDVDIGLDVLMMDSSWLGRPDWTLTGTIWDTDYGPLDLLFIVRRRQTTGPTD